MYDKKDLPPHTHTHTHNCATHTQICTEHWGKSTLFLAYTHTIHEYDQKHTAVPSSYIALHIDIINICV